MHTAEAATLPAVIQSGLRQKHTTRQLPSDSDQQQQVDTQQQAIKQSLQQAAECANNRNLTIKCVSCFLIYQVYNKSEASFHFPHSLRNLLLPN